ncbi:MAG: glycosyltransferase family 2 protein [Vicinamibacterales bacterium]
MTPMRVSVVIPTYNEEEAIGRVLADLAAVRVEEIIVVDSDSTDRTRDVAAAAGARVIRQPARGYGRACLTGLAAVTSPDIVVFLDGDYSDRPAELPRLVAPMADGVADLVIGSRLAGPRARGALPWHSVVGNRFSAWLLNRLCGLALTDLGPFRAARYEMLRSLDLQELTYGWPVEMIVKAALRGYRLVEVPVSYHPRIGRSKITGTIRGSVGAAWCMLTGIVKYRLREAART